MNPLPALILTLIIDPEMDAAGHQAPINGQLPGFAVINLSQTGQQQRVHRSLGRIRLFVALEHDGPVHEGAPIEQARPDKG